MTLMAKQSGSDFPPVEAGNFQAVCYSIVDLGTQHSEYFDNDSHKIAITWEIPELRIELERDNVPIELPRAITKMYTLSLSEKSNLYKDLVAWRGKAFAAEELEGFDVLTVIGANCLLQIIHTQKDNKTYANVAAVAKLLKGMPKKKPENPTVCYSMTTNGCEIPEAIPDWLKNIIKKSKEYQAAHGVQNNPDWVGEDPEPTGDVDDIPF